MSLVSTVEGMASTGIKVVEVNNEDYYLHAEAPSTVPKGGIDDLEFILLPDESLVLFRSSSRQSVFVYPLQQPVSDGGSNRARLQTVQRALGWPDLGYN